MPLKKTATTAPSSIYIVLSGTTIDSFHAAASSASARAAELKADGAAAKVEVQELIGGAVTLIDKPAPPAAKAEAKTKAAEPSKSKAKKDEVKEEEEAESPKQKKKQTKTPAEQREANKEKTKPGKTGDEDLPKNVRVLLKGMGTVLEGNMVVVTGVMPTLGRKNTEKLVVNYGGNLTKSLSKNTSLVVVGNDAGPTKLEKIEELGLRTCDEDEFIAMLEAAGAGGTKRGADEGDAKGVKGKKVKR